MSNTTDIKQLGHPTGIWVLCTTEMWERFAFYGMRAILVLYLVSVSTKETCPGFGWSEADAYRLYGLYTSLVYLIPLFGGWIADRFLGQFRAVILGGSLMAIGQFFLAATEFVRMGVGTDITMATDPTALLTFYTGLGLMILGNGFFKPCISVMVGQLYKPDEPQKRDAGFSFFYMGINIGAFFSPLIAGTVGEKFGYHLGFAISGLGMICGLITFWSFRRHLKGLGLPPKRGPVNTEQLSEEDKIAHEKAAYEQTRPLVKQDYDRMFVIVILTLFVVAFWMAFEQAGSSLNIFAKTQTNRAVASSSDMFVLIENEYRDDLEGAIKEVERSEAEITEILNRGTDDATELHKAEREVFSNRMKRLFPAQRVFSFFFGAKETEEVVPAEELLEQAAAIPVHDDAYYAGLTAKAKNMDAKQKKEFQEAVVKKSKEKQKELAKQVKLTNDIHTPGKTNFTFPASWYQSVNAFFVVLFVPLFILMWGYLAKRGIEPSTPMKFAIGILLLSIGFFLMIPGAIEAHHTGGKAWFLWLVGCYLFCTWGELCLSPVGLSMVSKLAPARYASVFMGIWFLSSSVAYLFAGEMAARFGTGEGLSIIFGKDGGMADFFLLLGIIPAVIGFVALLMVPVLKKKMHGIR